MQHTSLTSTTNLQTAVLADISHDELVSLAHASQKPYIGIVSPEAMMDTIIRSRKGFRASSMFGYRLGCDISTIVTVDDERTQGGLPPVGGDLFVTDGLGICKNDITHDDSAARVAQAKIDGTKVIAFFGGSTMMGVGARKPEFSIAALVEKILWLEHGIRAVCINRGVSGSYSYDALTILQSDVLLNPPDCVVFYDGWNCCHNLRWTTGFKDTGDKLSNLPIYYGMSLAQIDHDNTLHHHFDAKALAVRTVKLAAVSLLTTIANLVPNLSWRHFCRNIIDRFVSLKRNIFGDIESATPRLDATNRAQDSARYYWHIHRLAQLCCTHFGTQFLTVLQPVMWWANKPLTPNEKLYFEASRYAEAEHVAFCEAIVAQQPEADFLDLSKVFENHQDELFIDSGHLNRHGNYIVAQHISRSLLEKLK
jgi:hypothetical protein